MSKMPDPVAIYKPEYGICWTSSGMAVEAVDGIQFITTTQAEAYKDACVRAALENAAKVCDEQAMSYERSTENCDGDPTDISELRSKAWVVSNLARRIRFLIPK